MGCDVRKNSKTRGGFEISHDRYASLSSLRPQSPMSSDNQTTNQSNQTSSLETDISKLASLIATTTVTTTATTNGDGTGDPEAADGEDSEELGVEDVEELIKRLEAANGIAGDVEDELDGILAHLDGLLGSLEATRETKENGSPAGPQPDR